MESNTLEVAHLYKSYGRKTVVKDVSFSMHSGEVVGLLGPNGAGKTTMFYMIVGFIRGEKGTILLNQQDITELPMYRRARLGLTYLPQEPSVFRKLSVEDNIKLVAQARKDLAANDVKELTEQLLSEFGLEKLRKQKGYTLSGGERRRTEIARSLACNPKFLLLDEPFAGIDPKAVYEIKQLIQRLAQRGIGIMVTDHNVRDTLEVTHFSYIIHEGEILARGIKEDLLANAAARDVYFGEDFSRKEQ